MARVFHSLHGDTTMIIFGILISITAIGTLCWLLFNLAVLALPVFLGINAGIWAYVTGAGWLGAMVTGLVGAGLTLVVGRALLMLVRPVWARLLIALAFVAPAGMAGFYATLGITRQMMPSETWQIIFAVIGAVAVGATTFLRIAGMAATDPADGFPREGDAAGCWWRVRSWQKISPPRHEVQDDIGVLASDLVDARILPRSKRGTVGDWIRGPNPEPGTGIFAQGRPGRADAQGLNRQVTDTPELPVRSVSTCLPVAIVSVKAPVSRPLQTASSMA